MVSKMTACNCNKLYVVLMVCAGAIMCAEATLDFESMYNNIFGEDEDQKSHFDEQFHTSYNADQEHGGHTGPRKGHQGKKQANKKTFGNVNFMGPEATFTEVNI